MFKRVTITPRKAGGKRGKYCQGRKKNKPWVRGVNGLSVFNISYEK